MIHLLAMAMALTPETPPVESVPVFVRDGGTVGQGFVVRGINECVVATAFHVVEGAHRSNRTVQVIGIAGELHIADVTFADKRSDIALLSFHKKWERCDYIFNDVDKESFMYESYLFFVKREEAGEISRVNASPGVMDDVEMTLDSSERLTKGLSGAPVYMARRVIGMIVTTSDAKKGLTKITALRSDYISRIAGRRLAQEVRPSSPAPSESGDIYASKHPSSTEEVQQGAGFAARDNDDPAVENQKESTELDPQDEIDAPITPADQASQGNRDMPSSSAPKDEIAEDQPDPKFVDTSFFSGKLAAPHDEAFKARYDQNLGAMEIKLELDSVIVASAEGRVAYVGNNHPDFGNVISLKHANGLTTDYGFLGKIEVIQGQRVRRGARIGLSGASGMALRPSLFYRTLLNQIPVDPLPLFYQPPRDDLDIGP